MRIRLFIIFFGFIVILVCPATSFAKAQITNDLITVTPSLLFLDLQKDKPEADYYYKNDTNQIVVVSLSATDFRPLEDGYKISFIQGKDAASYKYRLSSWITFEKNTLIIPSHSSETVKVFINKNELTPGGHYAIIAANLSEDQQKGNLHIQGILSSFLFVRTNTGKETEEATIASLIPLQQFFEFPQAISLRFYNTGNTELIPYGEIQIKDFFGNIVSTGIINDASSMTLPESIKKYIVLIHNTNVILLPGIYTVTTHLHYGKAEKIINKTQSFFSFGSPISILAVLIVFPTCFFLSYLLLGKKLKNKKV